MQNISFQRIIMFCVGAYFLTAFWAVIPIPIGLLTGNDANGILIKYRLSFFNSYLPGQLIPLFFVALFSIFSIKRFYIKSKNIDLKVVFFLSFYVLFNTIIQAGIEPNLVEYRFSSLFATLLPFFFFFTFMTIDINEKSLNIITKYLFIGIVIYAYYYFNSYTVLLEQFEGSLNNRLLGQRDVVLLNFGFLLLILKNYHSNYFLRFFGYCTAFLLLYILLIAQVRLGYLLLLSNLLGLGVYYRKYFLKIFLPILVLMVFLYIFYFRNAGDVYELMTDIAENNIEDSIMVQINFGIARFNTMVDSVLSIFSTNYIPNGSERVRFMIWDRILSSVLQSPLSMIFGSGELGVHSLKDSFLLNDDRGLYYATFWDVNTSESQFFDTLFRRGLIGLVFLYTIYFRFFYLLRYLISFDKKFKDFYLAFYVWFFGFFVTLIFLPVLRDRAFALFFFIAYAILSSRAYIIRQHDKL